ncbi:MAG TPA: tetratricopeptide repeat protein [Saprospiraceae bacterium]|nr:tetratricopeptide repeat protein [Saprospiraceae bacterium]
MSELVIRLPLAVLAILWTTSVCAQSPELVPVYEENLQKATNDSARAMALQYLAFNLAHTDPSKSVAYGEEALRVAGESGNPWLLAQCQNGVGWAFFSGGNYGRARLLLDSAIQYMRETEDYFDLAPVCNNQGWVCLKQGDNLGALRYFMEGLRAAEACKDLGRIGFINRSIGSFYNAQKEFDKSIPHIKRALETFKTLDDSTQISDCLLTLGNAYSGMDQHETAISYYKQTLPFARQSKDVLGEALIHENWGISLSKLGRFPEAFQKLNESMHLLVQLNEQIEIAYLYYTIGSTHLLKGDTLKAIPSLEKAKIISTELALADIQAETLPALHAAYAATGAYEKAYQTLLSFQQLRDTSAVEERARDLQRLKTEYETERKEKDLQIKTLENARLQSRFWLALAGFGLAFFIGLAFWYRARQRRKTNAVLEAKNREVLAQKLEAERLRERAEQSEAVKEKFLAAMSHEIRTPMNAIVGLSQLLDAQPNNPATAHNISIIRQSGEHLMTILNDVLDLAKIEANKMELRPANLNLPAHIKLIAGTFERLASEKGVELKVELDPKAPEYVLADPVRLGQILNNLVSNAIKFTHQGSVTLAVTLDETLKQEPNVPITFTVTDTGIGIPAERQQAVFEEYTQADSGIAALHGGTGLGLSIARGLVAQMGGNLCLLSRPGHGTQFYFTLSLPVGLEEGVRTEKTQIPTLICKEFTSILLIEDNPVNQLVAQQILEAICPQLQLTIVDSGEKALEIAGSATFDLIFTDLQMPGMNGFDTARKLRALPFPGPILALTASAIQADEAKCKEAGMQEMLLKPVAPSDLAEALLRYLPAKLSVLARQTKVPESLVHFTGGNEQNAQALLELIGKEWTQFLLDLQDLERNGDVPGIHKILHKLKPQWTAMGLANQLYMIRSLEENPNMDDHFRKQLDEIYQLMAKTLQQCNQ